MIDSACSLEHRSYQGFSDLQAMLDLLTAGRQAANGTYYIHRGDLQWWLFYNDDATQAWKSRVRLWTEGGRLIGWSLLSPFHWHAFDVYAAPSLRGTDCERAMLVWAVIRQPAFSESGRSWLQPSARGSVRRGQNS